VKSDRVELGMDQHAGRVVDRRLLKLARRSPHTGLALDAGRRLMWPRVLRCRTTAARS
jgi:hypothetical protein